MDRPVVTFLSDFGLKDAYVAQVKARLLSGMRDAVIVDITHEAEPFGILSAAWLLFTSYPFFPEGTVHLCVVDPGVGTARRALVARKGGHTFVGPDNGVFSFIYPADSVTEVLWRPDSPVSPTFHGRDVFAPIVLELVKGVEPSELGRPLKSPVAVDVSRDMVVHIDSFGTLVTNIPCARLEPGACLHIGGMRVDTVAGTFADIPPGEPGLICGSASTVEVAVNRGRADEITGARVGDLVRLEYPSR